MREGGQRRGVMREGGQRRGVMREGGQRRGVMTEGGRRKGFSNAYFIYSHRPLPTYLMYSNCNFAETGLCEKFVDVLT